jgi:hypothetical protein
MLKEESIYDMDHNGFLGPFQVKKASGIIMDIRVKLLEINHLFDLKRT